MKIGVFATFMSPIANTQMIMDFGQGTRLGRYLSLHGSPSFEIRAITGGLSVILLTFFF